MESLKAGNSLNTEKYLKDNKKRGILIVDDSKFARNILADILQSDGYEIIAEAKNGLEAIEMTKEKKPKYIFLDVEMPILDGLGAIPEIMKIDSKAHIIMCTAMGQKNIIVEAVKAGAKDYVIKPYKKENILRVMSIIEAQKKNENRVPTEIEQIDVINKPKDEIDKPEHEIEKPKDKQIENEKGNSENIAETKAETTETIEIEATTEEELEVAEKIEVEAVTVAELEVAEKIEIVAATEEELEVAEKIEIEAVTVDELEVVEKIDMEAVKEEEPENTEMDKTNTAVSEETKVAEKIEIEAVTEEESLSEKEAVTEEESVRDENEEIEVIDYTDREQIEDIAAEHCRFSYLWGDRFAFRQNATNVNQSENLRLPVHKVVKSTKNNYEENENSYNEIILGMVSAYLGFENRLQQEDCSYDKPTAGYQDGIRILASTFLDDNPIGLRDITMSEMIGHSNNKNQNNVFMQRSNLSKLMKKLVQDKAERILMN